MRGSVRPPSAPRCRHRWWWRSRPAGSRSVAPVRSRPGSVDFVRVALPKALLPLSGPQAERLLAGEP